MITKRAMILGVGALSVGCVVPAGAAPVTQCAAGDTVVFSCSTGSRILSVCASGDIDHGKALMQYRYGPKGKPELVYPDEPRSPRGLFKPGTLMFSGGGGAYLKFTTSGHTYTVFSAIGNWGKTGKGTAEGVAVESNGKPLVNLRCRQDANFEQGELGPDFFEKAKLGEPEHDFDVPEVFTR